MSNTITSRMNDIQDARVSEPGILVRWMVRRDMPEVLEIERSCFDFPWPEREFVCYLQRRNVVGMVAEAFGRVAGYIVYEIHKNRLHIVNVAVAPKCRCRGVGRAMVEKLIGKLATQHRSTIRTIVRESNLSAQIFFRTLGFRATGILKRYDETTGEDAYAMICQRRKS